MDPLVLGLVLLAAILHASWNALVKVGGDLLVRLAMINAASSLCALPLIMFSGLPAPASWPYLLASILIHQLYYLCLLQSYRFGDLSQAYPIARGSAPLLVAIGAFIFAAERLTTLGIIAVLLICAAIWSLTSGWRRWAEPAVGFALLTGITIAAYTVCDGLGGRASENIAAYVGWLFFLEGLPIALLAVLRRRHALAKAWAAHWRMGLCGGLLAFSAYGLVIWAMSLTAMTYVSALRETSVIVAAFIGAYMLKEPLGGPRIAAATVMALGVMLLQWSGHG